MLRVIPEHVGGLKMSRFAVFAALAGLALVAGSPADARKKKAPEPPPAPVIPQVRTGDAGVDAYYFYVRQGQPLWLTSDAGRQAAARVVEVLKRAPIDGLADGPVQAATVERAIAGGSLDDDARISLAWLNYLKAVKAPAAGVEYGDPALTPKAPSAKEALSAVAAAPSMAAYIDGVARFNSFYASLRDAAIANGSQSDPHVKATLDRLRIVPDKGKVILVDTASQRLLMVEDGTVVGEMKVIIGRPRNADPQYRQHDQLCDAQPLLEHPARHREEARRALGDQARQHVSHRGALRDDRALGRRRGQGRPRHCRLEERSPPARPPHTSARCRDPTI